MRGSETLRGQGGRTANFAAFGSWPGVLPKNAESLRNSDALMRVAVPRRRGPAGLRGLFSFLTKLRLVRPIPETSSILHSNYTIKLVNNSTAALEYMRKVRTVFCPDFLAQS